MGGYKPVNAAMRAAAVDVDAVGKPDVGAVIGDDDRSRGILEINRLRRRLFFVIEKIAVNDKIDRLEPVRRVVRRSSAVNGGAYRLHQCINYSRGGVLLR